MKIVYYKNQKAVIKFHIGRGKTKEEIDLQNETDKFLEAVEKTILANSN